MLKKITLVAVFLLAVFLRTYNFPNNPPALYWEEAALGYDAYSILLTGKDHHGTPFPLAAFESFGDWKPAGYFYVLVPFIKLFGLTAFAVRLPTFLAGLSIVLGIAFIARKINVNPLIASAVAAVSPWLIQFSRSAWETTLATAFLVWGTILALRAVEQEKIRFWSLLAASTFYIFSMYTYHANRVSVPLLILGIIVLYVWKHKSEKRFPVDRLFKLNAVTLSLVAVISFILLIPFVKDMQSNTFTMRFRQTSIFSRLDLIEESNQLKEAAGNTVLSRILYHRYLLFAREISLNFLSHFNLHFLFLHGDKNIRHSTQFVGQLYHIELIFILVGIFVWLKKRKPLHLFFWYWMFVTILPASLTDATPHALRTLGAVAIFILLISTGIQTILIYLENLLAKFPTRIVKNSSRWLPALLIICLYIINFLPFWRYYTKIYPVVAAHEWQYGYKELMTAVTRLKNDSPDKPIYITREQGRPAAYYWFYAQTPPTEVQNANASAKKDQGEYLEFKNLHFIDKRSEIIANDGVIVSSQDFYDEITDEVPTRLISEVKNPDGSVVWMMYQLEE